MYDVDLILGFNLGAVPRMGLRPVAPTSFGSCLFFLLFSYVQYPIKLLKKLVNWGLASVAGGSGNTPCRLMIQNPEWALTWWPLGSYADITMDGMGSFFVWKTQQKNASPETYCLHCLPRCFVFLSSIVVHQLCLLHQVWAYEMLNHCKVIRRHYFREASATRVVTPRSST